MPSIVNKLAQLHSETLPNSLPAQLGLRYLERFYQSVENGRDEIILSNIHQDELLGGLLLSFAPETLTRRIILKTLTTFVPAFMRQFLTNANFRRQFIVVLLHGSHEPAPEVVYLFVKPNHQGEGIGRGLIQAATAVAKARNCQSIFVKSLADNSDGAQQFYRSLGFQEIAPRHSGSGDFISFFRHIND